MPTAEYDAIADLYAARMAEPSAYGDRVHAMLNNLLGTADSLACLDICCGPGAWTPALRALGWQPIGVDISAGQLRHAQTRMPVVQADATALPLADGTVPAAVCLLAHTDVPDYPAVVREAARVLRPGGVLIHIGVHPAFVGMFADRRDPAKVRIDPTYRRRHGRYETTTADGARQRVGAWHTTLSDLLQAPLDSGLTLTRIAEDGPTDTVPEILGFSATKPLWR